LATPLHAKKPAADHRSDDLLAGLSAQSSDFEVPHISELAQKCRASDEPTTTGRRHFAIFMMA
jgi:hypothetical protein